MMKYSTRLPAHSWEDTLPLCSPLLPLLSSLTLPHSLSFLLDLNHFPVFLSTTSFCLCPSSTSHSSGVHRAQRIVRQSKQGVTQRCCSRVEQQAGDIIKTSPFSLMCRQNLFPATLPLLFLILSPPRFLSRGVTCRGGCDWAHYLP